MRTTDDRRALELARAHAGVDHVASTAHGLSFQAAEHEVGALSLALAQAGIGILELTPELATLEDLFFRLTEDLDGASPPADGGRPGAGDRAAARASQSGSEMVSAR
jgi:hypothetical protein